MTKRCGIRMKITTRIDLINYMKYHYPDNFIVSKPRKVYFCIPYNVSSHLTDKKEKDIIKRILNGEEIRLSNKRYNVKVKFGYGTLAGINHFINGYNEPYTQFVVYNIKYLLDSGIGNWAAFHERWIELGEWAKNFIIKEVVIFT